MKSLGFVALCAGLAPACGSVGARPADDAGTPDARICFGRSAFEVCLAAVPAQPLAIPSPLLIDTTSSPLCAAVMGDGAACVVAATRIAIDANVRATGARPLVLLASDSITVAAGATIDAGSHRVRLTGTPETGPGADPMICGAGTPPGPFSLAGAAGGSFGGVGGAGGKTTASSDGVGGTPSGAAAATALRGGCPGQSGAMQLDSAPGGHGGGAVVLLAGAKIEVAGAILAGGEGGGGRTTAGGGGGGSGGLIAFDAPMVAVTGALLANGGGGGEGADGTGQASARDGADAITATEATGGSGGVPSGGDGGNGSAGAAGSAGKPGSDGTGGGGGGGGAGVILAPAAANLTFAQVSPMAAPLAQ